MPERTGTGEGSSTDGAMADAADGPPPDGSASAGSDADVGADGATECLEGETRACYTGPSWAEAVGACAAGSQTCDAKGVWSACAGDVHPAPEDCATSVDESCDGHGQCEGAAVWSRALGHGDSPAYSGATSVGAVSALPEGQVLVAGWLGESADLGGGVVEPAGQLDVFLGAYDPFADAHVWSRIYGGPELDRADALAITPSGNIVIAGYAREGSFVGVPSAGTPGGFLAELEPDGAPLWVRFFGEGGAVRLALGNDGEITVVGTLHGDADFGTGPLAVSNSGIFAARYDDQGTCLWATSFGVDTSNNRAITASTDLDGNVLVAVELETDPIDLGAGTIPHRDDVDVFLGKLDGAGNLVWGFSSAAKPYHVNNFDTGLAVDPAGDVVTVDFFAGSVTYEETIVGTGSVIAKYDRDGELLWTHVLPEAQAWNVTVDVNRDVVVGGFYASPDGFGDGALTGDSGMFIMKIDAAGQTRWTRGFANSEDGSAALTALDTDALASILVGGGFSGELDLGNGPMSSPGVPASFIAKLAP